MRHPGLILWLLLTCCLTLTGWVLREDALRSRGSARGALAVLFGDGRRLFANHFLAKADAYFHRGRYPSIFEMAERERGNALVDSLGGETQGAHVHGPECNHPAEEGHVHGPECEHEEEGESCQHAEATSGPDDWIARLAARFEPDRHVHLEGGREKEMLPWVRLAVEMDPHNVDAYTVGGYWLRQLGKAKEAEAFLREGQRQNPDSHQIDFELGRVYEFDLPNPRLAARLYELAADKWVRANEGVKEPNLVEFAEILGRLGKVQEKRGELDAALRAYTLLQKVSKNPEGVQRLIEAVRAQMERPKDTSTPQ